MEIFTTSKGEMMQVTMESGKLTHTMQRADGSQVRIVAQKCYGSGLTRSISVYVHRRKGPDCPWILCSDRPHQDWRTMTVDEYVKRGRPEMLQVASHGEILKVIHTLVSADDQDSDFYSVRPSCTIFTNPKESIVYVTENTIAGADPERRFVAMTSITLEPDQIARLKQCCDRLQLHYFKLVTKDGMYLGLDSTDDAALQCLYHFPGCDPARDPGWRDKAREACEGRDYSCDLPVSLLRLAESERQAVEVSIWRDRVRTRLCEPASGKRAGVNAVEHTSNAKSALWLGAQPGDRLGPHISLMGQVMMQDVVGDYDVPDTVPEWDWVVRHASFAHRDNAVDGVWEFIVCLARDFTANPPPPRLSPLFEEARTRGLHYLLFHQGT